MASENDSTNKLKNAAGAPQVTSEGLESAKKAARAAEVAADQKEQEVADAKSATKLAEKKKAVVVAAQSNAPARKDRSKRVNDGGARVTDLDVLIDNLPDEQYDAFVRGRNLNDRGVDVETGFDLRKVNNPVVDEIRLRLKGQGYNV